MRPGCPSKRRRRLAPFADAAGGGRDGEESRGDQVERSVQAAGGGWLQIHLRHEFGTNNNAGPNDLGRSEYGLKMIDEVQARVAGLFRARRVVAKSDGAQGRSAEGVDYSSRARK